MNPMLQKGSLKTAEPLVNCDRCSNLTSRFLGTYMGKKLVCNRCTREALKPRRS